MSDSFSSPQITDSRHIHVGGVLTDTAHTIYCTYHTVLQSTHYMQYEMQSHTGLMYSAGYEKPQKNSTVHVVKSGNLFPSPVQEWGVKAQNLPANL